MQTRHLARALLFAALLPSTLPLAAQDPNEPNPHPPLVPPAGPPIVPPPEYKAPLPDDNAYPMARPRLKPDGRITVNLTDGSRLIGKPEGLVNLKFKGSFGEIEVPLRSILGIRFSRDRKAPLREAGGDVLLFRNSDVLTGEMKLQAIEIKTLWGKASISIQHIESIINSSKPHVWVQDKRWDLLPQDQQQRNRPYRTHGGIIRNEMSKSPRYPVAAAQ